MKNIMKMILIITVIVSTISLAKTAKAETPTYFNDLKSGDFGFAEIIDLYERGVVAGLPGNKFQPNRILNRAQAAVMFQRALNLPIPDDITSFKDVKQGMYYTEAVAATKQAEIFKGNPDGTFGPAAQLSREQMASLIVRAMDLKPNPSTPVTMNDVDKINPAHQKDVLTLYQNGVTKGKAGNVFDPKGKVSRTEFSVFIVRGVGENLPPKKDEFKEVSPVAPAPIVGDDGAGEEAGKEAGEKAGGASGGGASGGAGAGGSISGPTVTASYLETASSERFQANVSNSNVTFTITKAELASLTTAKIVVSDNATMTVRVYIGDIDIDEERTQQLTAGSENDLNIAQTISENSGVIELLDSTISAQGTLVDDAGNSTSINLIFNIIE